MLDKDLDRVNIYAKIKAKVLSKKVKDIIDDVVNQDFDGLGANDAN
jgi:hypothetical protein